MNAIQGLLNSSAGSPTSALSSTSAVRHSDGDGDGSRRVGEHRGPGGGGGMARDLIDALQSLGVQLPGLPAAASSGDPATGNADIATFSSAAQAADGATQAVRSDLHEFMHQIFDAVRQADGGGSASDGGIGDPGAGLSGGLSSLIAAVGGGAAPSGLQSAFDQLMSDTGSPGSSAPESSGITLQTLLTQLQGQLGYGAPQASSSSVGNLVNSVA